MDQVHSQAFTVKYLKIKKYLLIKLFLFFKLNCFFHCINDLVFRFVFILKEIKLNFTFLGNLKIKSKLIIRNLFSKTVLKNKL